jgi:hypothetical protein
VPVDNTVFDILFRSVDAMICEVPQNSWDLLMRTVRVIEDIMQSFRPSREITYAYNQFKLSKVVGTIEHHFSHPVRENIGVHGS